MKSISNNSKDCLAISNRKATILKKQLVTASKIAPAEYIQALNSAKVTLLIIERQLNAAISFAKMSETDGPY